MVRYRSLLVYPTGSCNMLCTPISQESSKGESRLTMFFPNLFHDCTHLKDRYSSYVIDEQHNLVSNIDLRDVGGVDASEGDQHTTSLS